MLDATQKTIEGLDAVQVAALRKADRVCFFHRPKPDTTGETSYINAIKARERSERDPFAQDVCVLIPVDYRLTDYTEGEENRVAYGSEAFNAFEMIHSAQHDDAWKTTVSLLRAGDKLTLLWARGAFTTQHMKESTPKFFGDTLHLRVTRGDSAELGKYGKNAKTLTFHVDTRICEDNSARMVRRA
jgi:hypothetical protein